MPKNSIYFSNSVQKQLDDEIKLRGVSRSSFVQEATRHFLVEHKGRKIKGEERAKLRELIANVLIPKLRARLNTVRVSFR